MERFTGPLIDPLQVMPRTWLDTRGHVVFEKHPLEIIPRSDGVWPQTCEPVHGGGFKHDRQVVCHDVGASSSSAHGNGIACEPLLGIDLAVIGFNPRNLEAYRPLDGP